MQVVIFILVAIGAWLIGVFGWAQIIGSLQNLKIRVARMLLPLLLWLGIIVGTFFLVFKLLPTKIWAWVIGMGISLIQVLLQGKIK